jgi:hypothetical protein
MKFGEALPQRSVPEWLPCEFSLHFATPPSCLWASSRTIADKPDDALPDNLDYNEIKQLIKRYTTGRPLVRTPEAKTDFEDEFFDILMDQLGRVWAASMFSEGQVAGIDDGFRLIFL